MNLDGYTKRTHLTITELDSFARCPRKYFYQCGVGLRRPIEGFPGESAMHFGTSIHKAIGAYFSNYSVDEAISAFQGSWGTTIGDDKRNSETARMMLYSFSRQHPGKGLGLYTPLPPPKDGTVQIDKGDKISDWEIPFAIDIGLPIPLLGRIDGWCRSNLTGEIMLNEFKTSSEMSTRFLNGFKRSPQILGYTLAARAGFHQPVRGCYLEALKVAKTSWDTVIQPVEVPDFELERFLRWAKIIGTQILGCERDGDWPQFPSGCTSYPTFGSPGYMCEYDALCSVPEWEVMKNFYRVEFHVPYTMTELTVKGAEV